MEETDKTRAAARLKAALSHAGLGDGSQGRKALAAELGVSAAAISQTLSGQTKFSAENCARAAKMLGVSVYWLATGEGEMVEDQLSPEALRIAKQLDRLKRDPARRERALSMCELAAFGQVPSEQTPESVEASEEARQPTPRRLPTR